MTPKRFFRRCLSAGLVLVAPMAMAHADVAADFSKFAAGSKQTVDHSAWNKLLQTYVVPGTDGLNRVRYAAFKAQGQPALKAYIGTLEKVDVAALDKSEQFAFWANLYNAKTIDIVLDKYPVKSIKDINLGGGVVAAITGGPWKADVLRVGGQALSLDSIEHGILRTVFKDPRVHYSVNCASVGCPNLGVEAFTGANLEAKLDAAAKAYVNHPRGFKVEKGAVKASSIYNWFKGDFGGSPAGVLAHARKYADGTLKQELESITAIAAFDYDWNLNDAVK